MAGDWIKMRTDLAEDPAVISISTATGIEEDMVVGKLHRIWSWGDRQTTNGNAHSVTFSWVDSYLRVPGFAKAMSDAGWLKQKDSGIQFPRFDRHNGESGKKRALTAKRVAKHKAINGNGSSVTRALPTEEKRREEKNGNGVLINLTMEVLKDSALLLDKYWQCVGAGVPTVLPQGAVSLLRFFGAAERALEVGNKNQPGLFRNIVIAGDWGKISNVQEDRAGRRIKAIDRAQGGPR